MYIPGPLDRVEDSPGRTMQALILKASYQSCTEATALTP